VATGTGHLLPDLLWGGGCNAHELLVKRVKDLHVVQIQHYGWAVVLLGVVTVMLWPELQRYQDWLFVLQQLTMVDR
jgi:hypothetical protein